MQANLCSTAALVWENGRKTKILPDFVFLVFRFTFAEIQKQMPMEK